MTQTTLGLYFSELLSACGIQHIFGVPGNYIMPICDTLDMQTNIRHIPMKTESGAAWAAIGYAQARNGFGVCYGTYNVGAPHMLVAALDAKLLRIPLIVIGGEIGFDKRNCSYLMPHQSELYDRDDQLRLFEERLGKNYVCGVAEPQCAAEEFSELIARAHADKHPVYIGMPLDAWNTVIEIPEPRCGEKNECDSIGREPYELARTILANAKKPVLFVGHTALRWNMMKDAIDCAEAWNIPIVTSWTAHGSVPVNHPLFIGWYAGEVSHPPRVKTIVEESDCIIEIGVVPMELDRRKEKMLLARVLRIDPINEYMEIGSKSYSVSVNIQRELLRRAAKDPQRNRENAAALSFSEWARHATTMWRKERHDRNPALSESDVVAVLNEMLIENGDMPVVSDIGTAMGVGRCLLGSSFFTSYAGAMECGLKAIGVEMANKQRPLVIIGDQAFYMQMGELAGTLTTHAELAPIIVVLNNSGWGLLRLYSTSSSLDSPRGAFEHMPLLAGRGRGFRVETFQELRDALRWAEEDGHDVPVFINAIVAKNDMPEELWKICSA